MRRLLLWTILLLTVAAAVGAGWPAVRGYFERRNRPEFRTEKVRRGELVWNVQATGILEPVLTVRIGSFVSGPIIDLRADFNDQVEEGELLALVDPRLYRAAVERDKAALARAHADVERVEATYKQAVNDELRGRRLIEINEGYLSQSEMDQLRFNRESLAAQLKVAKLQIEQAQAQLENSELNLEYTKIVAPVRGVIIDRKIDPGQTLAAQFQTPELFVLAPEMDQRMRVLASVLEADVGHILRAQAEKRPVRFYVDAYEGELFSGEIIQVRQNPTTEQNVVSYPVVVETPNTDMKLLPGMTAVLSFEVDRRDDALLVPSAALRFVPERQWVRDEDLSLVDASQSSGTVEFEPSAEARVQANRLRRRRHVWVHEGAKLRAIPVECGLTDGQFYELLEGELAEGQELVWDVRSRR